MFGFYRVAAAVPKVRVCDVPANCTEIGNLWQIADDQRCAVVLFPELSLSAYTCGDLFFQHRLHEAVTGALEALLQLSLRLAATAIVGAPLWHGGRLYNCALVLQRGKIAGVVPKSYIPEHKEYYEKRWFHSGAALCNASITLCGAEVPFGVDLLFMLDETAPFGIEVCEDLWAAVPPSSHQAVSGSLVTFNPSASDEMVGKSEYRHTLVAQQSARTMGGYVYASCGVGESTTDLLFGGDALIAENGAVLERSERFLDESQIVFADLDLQKLRAMRAMESSLGDAPAQPFRRVALEAVRPIEQLNRMVDPYPFVPSKGSERSRRCREIFAIQTAALRKRLKHIRAEHCVIGISGGLDSTLALLVVFHTFELMKRDVSGIVAVTMPGFGTTGRTLENARKLCAVLGIALQEKEITQSCLDHFSLIGHDPQDHSVVYENVQARMRTQILMNLANKLGGIVVGTGDLSEAALGWSTYNGDHMSMYAVNIGIPKTLIRYIIEWYAKEHEAFEEVLGDILETPVSPELLPHKEGKIVQETEKVVGPYELHDFFLYHLLKYGASPKKILFLATEAFISKYDESVIRRWLTLFLRRFFSQQFKRSCLPDGPKVGTIALSPRGDWRMPSDASAAVWLAELEAIEGNKDG